MTGGFFVSRMDSEREFPFLLYAPYPVRLNNRKRRQDYE
jgi:hypothetical protein